MRPSAQRSFGLPDHDIDDERVWKALRAAQIDGLVCSLPGGLMLWSANVATDFPAASVSGSDRARPLSRSASARGR
jgi:hypothetical protein